MKIRKYLPVLILITAFLLFKISNLGIRLSDTNIYFYTAYKILQGKVLYRDIFFTNFPLLPYISVMYFLLTLRNLKLFFLTPAIEVCISAFFIYKIIFEQHTEKAPAFFGSLIYLFSFIILSTSDHQTGVFIASLFSILGYYFYLHKKYRWSGVFVTFMFLTKAYFIPIVLTFFAIFIIEKKWQESKQFLIGLVAAGFILMLPTLIFAFPDFLKDVFTYSLTRSEGVSKSNIVWFFITHDFLFFVLLAFSLFHFRKNKFLGFLSVFGILFFLAYQDIYYLYLNFLIPFLVLEYPEFSDLIQKKFGAQKFILPTFVIGFLLLSLFTYTSGFMNLQKINLDEAVSLIKQENPKSIYGTNDVTPALSYLTGAPMLDGIIDTNANIFRKGFLDSKKLTAEVIEQKSIIVAHGLDYPQNGIKQDVTDEIFVAQMVKKSCKLIGSYPVQTEGPENRLNLLKCY